MLRPRWLVALITGVNAVVILAVAGWLVAADLREVRARVEGETRADLALVRESVVHALDVADLLTGRVADRAAKGGAALTRGGPQPLLAQISAVPAVANLHVLDDAGHLLLDAKGLYPSGGNFADRDWFKTLADDPSLQVSIGQVTFDESARTHAFPVARRIVGERGRTVGFVVAQVDLGYFKRLYQQMGAAEDLAFGAYGLDGGISVRQPFAADDVGRSFAGSALFEQLALSPEGTFFGRSPYDALPRVLSYSRLMGRPLVVWASRSEQQAMEAARWRSLGLAAGALSLVGLGIALAVACWRGLEREQRESSDLAGLNRELERSNADLEQFAYIASHDLKEPLRNIASYVQLLQRRYQGKLDPDADAFIGYTVDGVRRMQAIISELLAYSRIGTGQLTLVPVQAGILVSSALAHLKGVIAEAQAAVEVKGPLPVVMADNVQLGSLFQNLIGNALKYRRDDVRSEVVIGCESRGEWWEFYVADNGIGIDAQYHRQIFDLFRRLHPRDRFPGTGIGLAICQRVVERHGGRIWVESVVGQGSTFRFTLPKVRMA
ncbi:sensor histidine kinase [Magnetospirillum aberrantis]|uniref:histidine kinase n=1 Tax=Magnetospirillum aberrantis SpK TaxID=908842 RepID=A0A7C9QU96_9PROT|nr:ATP-binding protein [Magnetospirillum aberrantis]NFV79456.1 hypothetical protein [Magnetospirillum aberrantis SpK]